MRDAQAKKKHNKVKNEKKQQLNWYRISISAGIWNVYASRIKNLRSCQ